MTHVIVRTCRLIDVLTKREAFDFERENYGREPVERCNRFGRCIGIAYLYNFTNFISLPLISIRIMGSFKMK